MSVLDDKKEKKYVSDNAQLMAEWDWEKNKGISPYTTTVGSRVSAYWLGPCGHAWEAAIKDRVRGLAVQFVPENVL